MNRLIPLIVVIALALTSIPLTAMAGHHKDGCGSKMRDLSEIDTNQDGLISFDEFSDMQTEKLKKYFAMIDKDDDELISEQEWNEFLKVHGKGDRHHKYKDKEKEGY